MPKLEVKIDTTVKKTHVDLDPSAINILNGAVEELAREGISGGSYPAAIRWMQDKIEKMETKLKKCEEDKLD